MVVDRLLAALLVELELLHVHAPGLHAALQLGDLEQRVAEEQQPLVLLLLQAA